MIFARKQGIISLYGEYIERDLLYSWAVVPIPLTSAIITEIRPPCNGRAGFFMPRYAQYIEHTKKGSEQKKIRQCDVKKPP